MKGRDERLMKQFWMRPAFQKQSQGSKWLKSFKERASTYHHTVLIVFLFFLFVSLLFFTGYIDLAKLTRISSSSHKTLKKNPQTTPLLYSLDCATWNHTNTCPRTYPTTHATPRTAARTTTCPDYFRWIHEDLKPWKTETGITKSMVEKAKKTAHFRLTVIKGRVYVEKFRPSIQTRALFTMWGIAQLARFYPGKIPDLELMFDCDDRPVVSARDYDRGKDKLVPPLFRYCSDWKSLDIVFPDWSFWGWAETNIKPWRSVIKDIKEGNKRTKWEDRIPFAYWRGNPHVCPWRADLMKCNVSAQNDWNTRLYVQDWNSELKQGFKQSNLEDQCTHRYKIYIEGWAWSVSEKYILACNSPTLLMTLRWHDFFIRGMIPQKHYWPVKENDKCKSLKFAVEWGNNHTDKAKAIGEDGSRFIHEDLKMEYVYDYMFHLLNEYAKLLKYKPTIPQNAIELCPESMACAAEGIWRRFMEESLEKSPSDSGPCELPPPYETRELKAFVDEKVKATREVEAWENEYWDVRNKKHN